MTSRAQTYPLLIAAILALPGCGGAKTQKAEAEPAKEAAPAAQPAAVSAAAAAAPSAAAVLSADYMVGKWSAINEDCSGTLEFRKNGTVATPIGDAKWTVKGDELAIDYGDGSAPTRSTIKLLGADRIEITHASGTKETEKRC